MTEIGRQSWVVYGVLRTADAASPVTAQGVAISLLLFVLAHVGLLISNAPYAVPARITFWQAAADPSSQIFMLIGTIVLLPLILAYTVLVFWLFRGKLRPGEGYH